MTTFYGTEYPAAVDPDEVRLDDPYADVPHTADIEEPRADDGRPVRLVRADEPVFTFTDGASFVLDVPEGVPAVWGAGQRVLQAQGEALMIVGGNGVGKTTVAGQYVKARIGLARQVLGLPVAPSASRVLYLAMDRPAQAARALGRLFTDADRDVLAERLVVRRGPPPVDLAQHTSVLVAMCAAAGADTCVVDSLKDAALGLSDDPVGAGWNRARQAALAEGVELVELHHPVKRGPNGGPPTSIADVYGSNWLTTGCGSVVSLHGAPGDPIVAFRHLKQPADEVGPFQVIHDHQRGTSAVHDGGLMALVRARGAITARDLASVQNGTEKPTPAQLERARRALARREQDGELDRIPGSGQQPDSYVLGPNAPTEGEG